MKFNLKSELFLVTLLGFSSGIPIMIVYSSLKIWLRRSGIELSTVGEISWLALPYSFNFLWGFILDRFYWKKIGRRKSWILFSQITLFLSIGSLYWIQPEKSISPLILCGLLISFFSATQDIAVDAYRREIVEEKLLGIASSLAVYGYRVGMLISSGLGLWAVDEKTLNLSFNEMFLAIAFIMLFLMVITLFIPEPKVQIDSTQKLSLNLLKQLVVDPFLDFFKRPLSWWILGLIFSYKLGDSLAGSILGAYYVDMNFDNKAIAEVTKGIGFISTMIGLMIGGIVIYKKGFYFSLMSFAIFQGCTSLLFPLLLHFPGEINILAFVVGMEDLSTGMGTSALIAYMASLTNKNFTASQYALFSSVASLGKTLLSGFAGHGVEAFGYHYFFYFCASLAFIGIIILIKLKNQFPIMSERN